MISRSQSAASIYLWTTTRRPQRVIHASAARRLRVGRIADLRSTFTDLYVLMKYSYLNIYNIEFNYLTFQKLMNINTVHVVILV